MKSGFISFILFLLFLFTVNARGEKTSITFRSNTETTVRVNKPIDGCFNYYFVSEKFALKPNVSINYEFDLQDFGFVRCVYSNGNIVTVLLLDGDHVEIDNINNKIVFKGDNAAGNQYLQDNYTNKGLGFHYSKVESIFHRNITTKIDFQSIAKEFQDSTESFYLADITKLKSEKQISARYATIMSQNLKNAYKGIMYHTYLNVRMGKINQYKPTTSEKIKIINCLDQLCTESIKEKDEFKYAYDFPFENYYILKYNALDSMAKAKLIGKCDTDTFGSYIPLLLAPDNIKLQLFKEVLAFQLTYQNNYFDTDKMLRYISIRDPDSEYLTIFKEYIKNTNKKKKAGNDSIEITIIDGKNIHTIKDLLQENGLKGKNLYIDLWATWCTPCKYQFQFNTDLHKLIDEYNNLNILYLSVDKAKDEKAWKSQIENFHLSGYNLRASEALLKDIRSKIYDTNDIVIPRYVLIDAQGNILNNNLPKPQRIDSLRKVLNAELKLK